MRAGSLTIPRLHAGGLNLGYRCSSRCRHCLYACGPHRDDGLPAGPEAVREILDELESRAPGASLHIGGGEPFLDLDLLCSVLEDLRGRRLGLEYVETNASWARSEDGARETLAGLRSLGLGALLVSASHFHAEFVKPSKTLTLIRLAHEVLGGVIVWLPDFIRDLASLDQDRRIDLDALIEERGPRFGLEVGMRYGVIPGGRGGRFLASQGHRLPWEQAARRSSCLSRLENTTHFHVDLAGNYVPGLCGGIVLPLSLVPGDVPLGRFPILERILAGGLDGLAGLAISEYGFEPDPEGYAGACDLCTHIRIHLHPRDTFEELGPPGFYDSRSISGY